MFGSMTAIGCLFCAVVQCGQAGADTDVRKQHSQPSMQHLTSSLLPPADCLPCPARPACPACLPQVGTISANGEREIGELIARAMEKVRPAGAAMLWGAATCMRGLWCCPVPSAGLHAAVAAAAVFSWAACSWNSS